MLLVQKKQLLETKKELETQIEILSKRLKQAKLRILQLEVETKSIDEKVKDAVSEFIKNKIRRIALKSTEDMMQQIQDNIMNKATNNLFDMVRKIAKDFVKAEIEKDVMWKTKKFIGNEIEIGKILAMYDKGWKVAFYGKLDSEHEILLMEKPALRENENAKPKRNPKF